jgi:hypothetical protein
LEIPNLLAIIYLAIIVELSFITLSVLVWRGYTKTLYPCIALALTVIIGNTASPAHIHLMTTFSKPANALILIIGGYILQGILIYTSLKTQSELDLDH